MKFVSAILRCENIPRLHTHGNAQVDGRIVLFFYFQDGDTGMMMLIPGVRGEGDVARFHLTGGLTDPQKN